MSAPLLRSVARRLRKGERRSVSAFRAIGVRRRFPDRSRGWRKCPDELPNHRALTVLDPQASTPRSGKATRAASPPLDINVRRVAATDALQRLDGFDAVIDTRSESEYALDHLPGALNWPSLRDAERARVGTLYAQVSPFDARKLGAALVARNVAQFIEQELADTPRTWRPLLYCWRGGQRSRSFAHILGQIGFRVQVVEGGYKALRAALLADLPEQATRLSYRVLCGPTGSGKTRLLGALAQAGGQTLDLEALACHRASVLGSIPGQPQPTQKHFEMQLWDTLRKLDPTRPVFAEAESKKVGDLTLPEALIQTLRASPCLRVDLADRERVALLMEDYPQFVNDPELFCERLDALVSLLGHAMIGRWQELARDGQTAQVVQELLEQHYDPGYASSTRRNFSHFADARVITLADRGAAALARAARDILAHASGAADSLAAPPGR